MVLPNMIAFVVLVMDWNFYMYVFHVITWVDKILYLHLQCPSWVWPIYTHIYWLTSQIEAVCSVISGICAVILRWDLDLKENDHIMFYNISLGVK
jgi:hypothetical protein